MTTSGLIMMLTWCGIVTFMAGYFLYRVITAKKKDEPDSFKDND